MAAFRSDVRIPRKKALVSIEVSRCCGSRLDMNLRLRYLNQKFCVVNPLVTLDSQIFTMKSGTIPVIGGPKEPRPSSTSASVIITIEGPFFGEIHKPTYQKHPSK